MVNTIKTISILIYNKEVIKICDNNSYGTNNNEYA